MFAETDALTLFPTFLWMHRLDDACADGGNAVQCELSAKAGSAPGFGFFEYAAPWEAGVSAWVLFAAILLHLLAAHLVVKIQRLGGLILHKQPVRVLYSKRTSPSPQWQSARGAPADVERAKADIMMRHGGVHTPVSVTPLDVSYASRAFDMDKSIDFDHFWATSLSPEHHC